MGITLLIAGIAILVVSFFGMYMEHWAYAFILVAFIPLLFVCLCVLRNSPPPDSYPLRADVIIKDSNERIYFSGYSQDGNKVTVSNYCQDAYHWKDWVGYNAYNEPLTIVLTNGQFTYTDRITGITYKVFSDSEPVPVMATQ